jgi:hypothetical protein
MGRTGELEPASASVVGSSSMGTAPNAELPCSSVLFWGAAASGTSIGKRREEEELSSLRWIRPGGQGRRLRFH